MRKEGCDYWVGDRGGDVVVKDFLWVIWGNFFSLEGNEHLKSRN